MGNYRPFLQGPLPVANYTRIIIPGRFWTRPPSTKSTRMASSATPLHDSLIELAIPDAHAHAIKWYLKQWLVVPVQMILLLQLLKESRRFPDYHHWSVCTVSMHVHVTYTVPLNLYYNSSQCYSHILKGSNSMMMLNLNMPII